MDVKELRADLHNMIDKISDRNILNAVRTILSEKVISKTDWWDTICDDERKEIEEGLSQAEKDEVTSHEEVMRKYEKWL